MTSLSYETKRKIGYVPEEICLFGDLSVYENIDYFCSLYIKDKKKREELVEEVIKDMGKAVFLTPLLLVLKYDMPLWISSPESRSSLLIPSLFHSPNTFLYPSYKFFLIMLPLLLHYVLHK